MVDQTEHIYSSHLHQVPELSHPPRRVVSLVPSITESLFDLDFGNSLVGITEQCIHPERMTEQIRRLGASRHLDLQVITELQPDLIFANPEVNALTQINSLASAGNKVWVSFPKTIDDVLDMLRSILAIYHSDSAVALINSLQMAVDWAREAARHRIPARYFCPVSFADGTPERDVWLTFNQHTYSNDLLSAFGGENAFAGLDRRPSKTQDLDWQERAEIPAADARHPLISNAQIMTSDVDLVILPSGPFPFTSKNKIEFMKAFPNLPAVRKNRVLLIDGTLITWPGTRLAKAVHEIPSILDPLD